MNAYKTVSADQVAAMRAYLSGDRDLFVRLNRMLDRSKEGAKTYHALIVGIFAEAVALRFDEQTSRNEVIEYVADLRSRDDGIAEALDPENAERIIMTAIADDDVDDLSGDECLRLEMILMAGFVADAEFSVARLDAFLEKSRRFANGMLA